MIIKKISSVVEKEEAKAKEMGVQIDFIGLSKESTIAIANADGREFDSTTAVQGEVIGYVKGYPLRYMPMVSIDFDYYPFFKLDK